MLAIPSAIKTLFQTDGVLKNFRVHFPNGEYADITNENVVKESLHFTESICSQSTFRFGLAEASVIEFETVGIGNMYGMTIECGIEIDTSSLSAAQISAIQADPGDGTLVLASASDIGYGFYRVPLGVFRVESCPRNHGAMTHRKVTAYTATLKTATLNFPEAVWPTVLARPNAISAAAIGSGLTEDNSSVYGGITSDSSNVSIPVTNVGSGLNYFTVNDTDAAPSVGALFVEKVTFDSSHTAPFDANVPAFIRAIMPDYDPVAYDAAGVAIANAFTAANFEFRYDTNYQRVFDTNEAALRVCAPWLFSPCLIYWYHNPDFQSGSKKMIVYAVKDGGLVPVLASKDYADAHDAAFFVNDPDKVPYENETYFVCVCHETAGNHYQFGFLPGGGFSPRTLDVEVSGYPHTLPTVKAYKLNSYPSNTVSFSYDNTGTGYFLISGATQSVPTFIFNPIPLTELAGGELELEAAFGKSDRKGGTERFNLDNSSPISIQPGDYEEVWWDEYDVSPIGTVSTVYRDENNEEQEAEISVGAGTSVYELADNAIVAALDSNTLSDITSIIQSSFAPHLGAVAFTPVDLTTQGWPWLEAGDALEIEAEDGTTVETYALRVEMSGIQKLTMNIVSEGGEIISEV